MTEQSLTVPMGAAVQRFDAPNLLETVRRAAADPACDVAKMQALMAMAERMQETNARNEFNAALSRLQVKMPRVTKDGEVVVSGVVRNRYAKLETIDKLLKPLLAEEGFAISFDTRMADDKLIVSGKLTHAAGHSESKEVPLALDTSGSKNGTQATGSTISYGQRYLVKMFFNIVEDGQDTDGNPPLDPITLDQAIVLRDLIAETKSDERPLLKWAGAASVEEISKDKYAEAAAILRRRVKK